MFRVRYFAYTVFVVTWIVKEAQSFVSWEKRENHWTVIIFFNFLYCLSFTRFYMLALLFITFYWNRINYFLFAILITLLYQAWKPAIYLLRPFDCFYIIANFIAISHAILLIMKNDSSEEYFFFGKKNTFKFWAYSILTYSYVIKTWN